MDYYVLTPFSVYTKPEWEKEKERLAKEGHKLFAVVFNCKDYEDFRRKYFHMDYTEGKSK